ncbi:partitioning defective 3 homolog isoform X3 [Varroa jacobsoni]|uniref:partitioning defective 3 homolog isoform X3 n=1 Tax=Varroa jacobsoni TaxID=62625 RepID=UPI000BF9DE84|nr:partitioning defective 3 homolog isoform X3 [Varroa jacobsoni]
MSSMKVTVNFGAVRVIVPCGVGDIPVREVLELAVVRYKKATNKPADAWVSVHNVKSYKDDAILDQDDLVGDVCDDRENLIALFAEQGSSGSSVSPVAHQTGDCTSASSAGTESPDLFIENHQSNNNNNGNVTTANAAVDEKLSLGTSSLHVRRGSEPALSLGTPGGPLGPSGCEGHGVASLENHGKRWSAAVVPEEALSSNNNNNPGHGNLNPQNQNRLDNNVKNSSNQPYNNNNISLVKATTTTTTTTTTTAAAAAVATRNNTFVMDTAGINNNDNKVFIESPSTNLMALSSTNRYNRRRSQSLHRDTMGRTDDSEDDDRIFRRTTGNFNRNANRRSMLASAYEWYEAADRTLATMESTQGWSNDAYRNREAVVVLPSENGPLGIHVVPEQTNPGLQGLGLVVQNIEPGGRVDRDGRLQVGDRIVEVNGKSLLKLSFQDAQDVFRSTLDDPQIVIKVSGKSLSLPTSPVTKVPPAIPPETSQTTRRDGATPERTDSSLESTSTPKKEMPIGVTPGRVAALNAANTRKIGKKVNIELTKGEDSLGFSLTTRDNLSAGLAPIYIKNILPRGAAIQDGRLRSGDRLLEVNGIEVTGKSQPEVVAMLRAIPTGSSVHLVVSRQECLEQNLPREIPPEKADAPPDEVGIYPWKERHIVMLDISPTDTGSAGLGISVKGKTSTNEGGQSQDMGLFIKSVIHGGAASKDGRLKPNDQLLKINGESLLGKTNSEAMDTLRHSMFKMDGPYIRLTIARRLPSADSEENLKFEEGFLSTSSGSSSMTDSKENVSQTATYGAPSPYPPNSTSSGFINGTVTPPQDRDRRNESVYGSISKRNPVIEKLMGSPGQLDVSSVLDSQGSPLGSTVGVGLQQMIYGRSNVRPTPVSGSPPTLTPQSSAGALEKNGVLLNEDYAASVRTPNGRDAADETSSDQLNTSDMSLAIDGAFSRDGFGRQSMSEKRHAHLDAKNTDTYRRNKETREQRLRQSGQTQDNSLTGHRLQQSRSGGDLRQRSMSQDAGGYREASIYRSNSADSITAAASQLHLHQAHSSAHGHVVIGPTSGNFPLTPQQQQHGGYSGHNKENKKPSPEFDHRPLPLVPRTPAMFPVQMFYQTCCTMANGESPGTESSTMSHDNNSSGMVRPSLRCLPLSMQRSSSLESLSAQQQQQHPNSSGNQQPHKRGNPSFRQAVDKNVPPSLPQTVGQTPWDGVTPPTKSFKRVQRVDEDLSPDAVHTPLRGVIPLDSFSPLSPDEKPRKKGFFRGMFRFGKNRKTIPEPGCNKHSMEAERRRIFLEDQKRTRQGGHFVGPGAPTGSQTPLGHGVALPAPRSQHTFQWERTQVAATRLQVSSPSSSGRLTSGDYASSPNQNGLPLVSHSSGANGHPQGSYRSQRLPPPLEEWYNGRRLQQQQQQQMHYDPYGAQQAQPNGRPLPPIPSRYAGPISQFQAIPPHSGGPLILHKGSQFCADDIGHFSRSISLRSNRSSHSHLDYGIVTRGMKQYTVFREIERPGSRVGVAVDGSSTSGHVTPGQNVFPHYANVGHLQQPQQTSVHHHHHHQRQSSEPAPHVKPRPSSNYCDKVDSGAGGRSGAFASAAQAQSSHQPALAQSCNPAHVYATMARPTAAPRTSMTKIPSGSKV